MVCELPCLVTNEGDSTEIGHVACIYNAFYEQVMVTPCAAS
jgi:hypothetical protein